MKTERAETDQLDQVIDTAGVLVAKSDDMIARLDRILAKLNDLAHKEPPP